MRECDAAVCACIRLHVLLVQGWQTSEDTCMLSPSQGCNVMCTFHPTVCGHAAMAAALLPFVQRARGWNNNGTSQRDLLDGALSGSTDAGKGCGAVAAQATAQAVLFQGVWNPLPIFPWASSDPAASHTSVRKDAPTPPRGAAATSEPAWVIIAIALVLSSIFFAGVVGLVARVRSLVGVARDDGVAIATAKQVSRESSAADEAGGCSA